MTVAVQRLDTSLDRLGGPRFVQAIRFGLPLFLFALATGFEFFEHVLKHGSLSMDPMGWTEILVFGVLGPSAVFFTLTYMARLMEELERTRNQAVALNQNLEALVAQRTAALQASNAELAQANQRLRELDRMKSEFVSLVSHELRAPLATINGGLEVAAQDMEGLKPKSQRVLRLLMAETNRLTQFVQTLLDVAQLEAGKLHLTLGPVALRPLLARAAEVTLGPEQERLVWRLPDALPPVLADEIYTEQVMCNLLSNAVKYTPPGTPIEVSATVHVGTVQVCVTDYGPGISAEEQERIFERFYRSSRDSERRERGWGLGLYFARALVKAQGGTLTVQSPVHADPDRPGSRFIVTLPMVEEEPDDDEVVAH